MTPEELKEMTDGGTALEHVPGLELEMVDPEKIAVDPMNERTDEPLDTEDLERSVAKNGVVEPPVCRVANEDAKVPFTVIQGQRRVTAAQAVQLDEIPILVGEFEDEQALVRSITENIKAGRKDVGTQTRAAAIWKLWTMKKDDPDNLVSSAWVASELGVPRTTAAQWIQPLRAQYAGTAIDARVSEPTGDDVRQLSEELQDVSPKKLEQIASVASGEQAEELVKEAVESDLSTRDLSEMAKQPGAEEDPFQALEEVKIAKQASEETRGFMLNRMRFGDETGGALRQAARATGKDKSVVVKDAVGYYLREEGYL
jgi:ParB/RepB/Spo0J family partition protein